MQLPHRDLLIQIEVSDILLPVVDSNAMHLIRLEHHQVLLLQLDDHTNVVIVTHSEESLKLGTEVLCSE